MNQNMGTSDNQNASPYKATGNLNTMIDNPSANINDTMNVNIQNMQNQNLQQATVLQQGNNQQMASNPQSVILQQNSVQNDTMNNNMENTKQNDTSISNQVENENTFVQKQYVSSENKTKKKTISLNIGPEFKIALLIIIILLVFILLLPLIPNLFRG